MADNDPSEQTLLDKVQRMQDGLVSFSTGNDFDGGDTTYQRLRQEILDQYQISNKLPDFIRRYRNLNQFWQFIKHEYGHYAERREFLWDNFRPLIDHLENSNRSPGIQPIAETLKNFDPNNVHAVWQKALDRRDNDPEGAITSARTLLETTCKHILDDAKTDYPDSADLPKLWSLCSEILDLAPNQHQEKIFKSILGNCQSIVNNIGAIRNSVGDAHGTGRRPVKPKPRHAELTVNLAGTMASFLIATWQDKNSKL